MQFRKMGLTLAGIILLVAGVFWLRDQVPDPARAASFITSILIFLIFFTFISLRWMHETAAALLGAVAVFLVHYVGGKFSLSLRIIGFEEAMAFVDCNVIFLILGMMITKYAEVNQIDLIILCSRGLTGITRWLMGSVADRVLRGTTIPILMIPAKNEEVLTA